MSDQTEIKKNIKGNSYFTINVSSEQVVNLYINNYLEIPLNKVVYDYFNSGELFVNASPTSSIVSVTNSMATIFSHYIISDDNDSFMKNPDTKVSQIPSWTSRFVDARLNGWMFDLSLIFNLKQNNISVPICTSYTGKVSSGNIVVSPQYHFGNMVNSSSVCSNPKVYTEKTVPHVCPYAVSVGGAFKSDFNSCPFYQYDYELVRSILVNKDSLNSKVFELRKIVNLSGSITFQIFDVNLNQINYLFEHTNADESFSNALNVLSEITSSYDTFEDTAVLVDAKDVPKKAFDSYILSLV